MESFTMWLLVAVIVYWLFCILVGVFSYRKGSIDPTEYFLAGRSLGPIILGLSMLATVQSAWLMLGHQGQAGAVGLAYVSNYSHIILISMVALFFFGQQWLLGKKFGFITPGEMFGAYYGNLTRILMVILGVLYVIPYSAMQLIGGGTVFEVLTGGTINYTFGAILMSAVVVIYVFLGGLRAAAITDTFQGTLLVIGIFVLAGVVLAHVPGGFAGVLQGIQELPQSWRLLPGENGGWGWPFVLTYAIAVVGIYTSPVYTMWAFSARSPRIFRWQLLVIMSLVAGFYYFILSPIIGGGGRVLFGALENPDSLTPLIMAELMPTGLALLTAIAIFAAMNSTADAYLASISSLLSRDIYKPYINKEATPKQQVNFGRFMVVLVVVIGLFFAMTTRDVIALIGGLATSFGLQTVPALLGLLYWRRLTPAGVNAGLVAGMITVYLTYQVWPYPLGVHSGVWAVATNLLVAYLVSLFTPPVPAAKQQQFRAVLQEGQRVYQEREARGLNKLRIFSR